MRIDKVSYLCIVNLNSLIMVQGKKQLSSKPKFAEVAIGFAGEYLSRNCHERAESFSDRSEKGKYRSIKC